MPYWVAHCSMDAMSRGADSDITMEAVSMKDGDEWIAVVVDGIRLVPHDDVIEFLLLERCGCSVNCGAKPIAHAERQASSEPLINTCSFIVNQCFGSRDGRK
mmetsp:Transcript_2917/g.6380  ORF Transcript_2917/g.6380 Transcript_2917/m.6380 type:complete len:102 (-) Transcript_2917:95-400(-)